MATATPSHRLTSAHTPINKKRKLDTDAFVGLCEGKQLIPRGNHTTRNSPMENMSTHTLEDKSCYVLDTNETDGDALSNVLRQNSTDDGPRKQHQLSLLKEHDGAKVFIDLQPSRSQLTKINTHSPKPKLIRSVETPHSQYTHTGVEEDEEIPMELDSSFSTPRPSPVPVTHSTQVKEYVDLTNSPPIEPIEKHRECVDLIEPSPMDLLTQDSQSEDVTGNSLADHTAQGGGHVALNDTPTVPSALLSDTHTSGDSKSIQHCQVGDTKPDIDDKLTDSSPPYSPRLDLEEAPNSPITQLPAEPTERISTKPPIPAKPPIPTKPPIPQATPHLISTSHPPSNAKESIPQVLLASDVQNPPLLPLPLPLMIAPVVPAPTSVVQLQTLLDLPKTTVDCVNCGCSFTIFACAKRVDGKNRW